MSQLFIERDVEIVTLALNNISGGTTTITVGADYFAEGAIYSGSPEVYPVLADSPSIFKRVETQAYVESRETTKVSIYGKTALSEIGFSLHDLTQSHSFQDSTLTIYYYPKTVDAITTNSSANVRAKLTIYEVDWKDDGTVELSCRFAIPKDRKAHKFARSASFPTLDQKYDGEILPSVFGRSVIIDAPVTNRNAGGNFFYIFAGWRTSGTLNDSAIKFYVKNPNVDLSLRQWIEIPSSPTRIGQAFGALPPGSSSWVNMKEYWRGINFSGSTVGDVLPGTVTLNMRKVGTPDGTIEVKIYRRVDGQPFGQPITQASILGSNWPVGETGTLRFSPLVPLPSEGEYIAVLEWSNITDNTNRMDVGEINSGPGLRLQDKAVTNPAWGTAANVTLHMGIFSLKLSTSLNNNGSGSNLYNTATISEDSILVSTGLDPYADAEYKLEMNGRQDDSSGTYTGSALAIIERPADLVKFMLWTSTIGLNWSSGLTNTTEIAAVRSAMGDYRLHFAITKETTTLELIYEICRQSRMILIYNRDGKLSLNYQDYSDTADEEIDFTHWGHDAKLLDFDQLPHATILNSFNMFYNFDTLTSPTDGNAIRNGLAQKYSSEEELTGSDSTAGDTAREAAMAASEALYGKRAYSGPEFDMIYRDDEMRSLTNYLADRYSGLLSEGIVRLPRRYFSGAIDMFDRLLLASTDLPDSNGTLAYVKLSYDGEPVKAFYNEMETYAYFEGMFQGIVLGVREQGEFIEFVIESETPY